MKRLFAIVALLMCVGFVGSVSAQDLQKNIVGVRAGVNISTMGIKVLMFNANMSSKLGYNAGVSYERLLLKKAPLYLETGLYYSNKGFKGGLSILEETDQNAAKCNLGYLQVPLMINYKFIIKDVFAITPSAGFYYAFGVTGRMKEVYELGAGMVTEVWDVYADDTLRRSDLGYRCGLSLSWKDIVLGFAYEGSMMNILKPEAFDDELFGLKAHNSNFTISLGYNF